VCIPKFIPNATTSGNHSFFYESVSAIHRRRAFDLYTKGGAAQYTNTSRIVTVHTEAHNECGYGGDDERRPFLFLQERSLYTPEGGRSISPPRGGQPIIRIPGEW